METKDMETRDNETVSLKSIIVKCLHHWKLFAGVFVFSFIPAILYLVLYPRTYEMMARIRIQEDREMSGMSFGLGEAAGLMKSMGIGTGSLGPISIDDELAALTSSALLRQMAFHLGVNVEYTRPYSFYRLYEENPLVLFTDSATDARLDESIEMGVSVRNGKVEVNAETERTGKRKFEFASLPAVISLPYGDFTLDYAPGVERMAKGKMNIAYNPSVWTAEGLAEDFLIEEYSKSSSIIELSCRDHEKRRGTDMLNTLIAFYNRQAFDYKEKEFFRMLAFLDVRIDSLVLSLADVENSIAAYKNRNRLTDMEHDIVFYVEQMKEIQVKLIELEAQSHVVRMLDDFVKNPVNKYAMVPTLLSQETEGSSIMVYNQILLERTRVIQNSGMNNPLVKPLTEQVDQLRESVYTSISNAGKGIQLAIDDVKAKEKALFDKMGGFPDQEREYVELRRQQEILQGVYLILLQKREETALNNGVNKEKARVVDTAFVKKKPVAPRKLFAAIGMMVFTLLAPAGYLFAKRQWLDLITEYKNSVSSKG